MDSHADYQCSFCSNSQSQVKRLIAGPDRVFICDECVGLCEQIIADGISEQPKEPWSHASKRLNPKWIFNRLEEYVVGQDLAKKVLSVAVYNHYKRIWPGHDDDVELQKANILMVGPSGCGKTHLGQTLAKILDVPLAIADATSLTEAGYVGEDVENILLRLIQAADYDISKAEHGIIYIDEIDKIARKNHNPSITRDVSGEGVQQALLKIIEGYTANIPPQGGRKHPQQDYLQLKTNNILFMCGGAFEGMDEIIERRVFKDRQTIGFQSGISKLYDNNENSGLLNKIASEDLLEYGYIPEFIGRLPVVVTLDSLNKDSLIRVLTEPRNAFVKQYKCLFKMDNLDLVFTDKALDVAAERALAQKTGARGLRTILEQALLDVMYELPSMKGVSKCVVDENAILGTSDVALFNLKGQKLPMPYKEQKSA